METEAEKQNPEEMQDDMMMSDEDYTIKPHLARGFDLPEHEQALLKNLENKLDPQAYESVIEMVNRLQDELQETRVALNHARPQPAKKYDGEKRRLSEILDRTHFSGPGNVDFKWCFDTLYSIIHAVSR